MERRQFASHASAYFRVRFIACATLDKVRAGVLCLSPVTFPPGDHPYRRSKN
jgi:hypothetical protein